jgi:hypothetical protein
MAKKDRKNREHKPAGEERDQQVNSQKPLQDVNRNRMPGQAGPGAIPERSADRNSKGKARP